MKSKRIIIAIFSIFIFASVITLLSLYNNQTKNSSRNNQEKDLNSDSLNVFNNTEKEYSDNIMSSTDSSGNTFYDGTAPIIFKMGEPLTISSFIGEDEQTKLDAVYDKSLIYCGWNGEMEFTVTGATMYDTFDDTGITDTVANYVADSIGTDSPKYVVINLDIKNISATERPSSSSDTFLINFMLDTSNEFSLENFKEVFVRTNKYNSLHFFSLHGDTDKEYYSFTLPKGSTVSSQLGFFVSQRALENDDLILNIGYASGIRAYGIELNNIEDFTK